MEDEQTIDERANKIVGFATNVGTDGLADVALFHLRNADRKATDHERDRCLAIVQYAREQGETDARQIRNWIQNVDFHPSEGDGDA